MWVYDDHLSVRNGYGSKTFYHYPLPNNRWLVTTLHGDPDMKRIIDIVESGSDLGLTIESVS